MNRSKLSIMSQIMIRAELFSVKKILHHKYTTTKNVFSHKVQNDYDINMQQKKQIILFDILGPSDIFVMEMSVIFTN